MPLISYSVLATLPDSDTARSFLDWLTGGHVQAVIAGGARTARVIGVHTDGSTHKVEISYTFADQAAFDRYEQVHAPALRADGAARFGTIPGVSFERRVGSVIFQAGSGVDPP
jgi:hypothetical protein